MAKPLRPKRGTTAKNDAFTGLANEITLDTEKHSIRIHDGVTAGGVAEILPKDKVVTTEGGTMTESLAMNRDVTNDRLIVMGGTNADTGAYLRLSGKDESGYNGNFVLRSNDGTNAKNLTGNPDGHLKWEGTDIDFSTTGTISSGGPTRAMTIRNGTAAAQGAGIWLYGVEHPTHPGLARIQVYDTANSKYKVLDINANGSMKWQNNEVVTAAGGTMKGSIRLMNGKNSLTASSDDGFIEIEGGTEYGKGCKLTLYGIAQSEYPGGFRLTVTNGTANTHLQGTNDGVLSWGGRKIPRIVEVRDITFPAVEAKKDYSMTVSYVTEKLGNRFAILERYGSGTHWAGLGYRLSDYTDTGFKLSAYNMQSSASAQLALRVYVFEY